MRLAPRESVPSIIRFCPSSLKQVSALRASMLNLAPFVAQCGRHGAERIVHSKRGPTLPNVNLVRPPSPSRVGGRLILRSQQIRYESKTEITPRQLAHFPEIWLHHEKI